MEVQEKAAGQESAKASDSQPKTQQNKSKEPAKDVGGSQEADKTWKERRGSSSGPQSWKDEKTPWYKTKRPHRDIETGARTRQTRRQLNEPRMGLNGPTAAENCSGGVYGQSNWSSQRGLGPSGQPGGVPVVSSPLFPLSGNGMGAYQPAGKTANMAGSPPQGRPHGPWQAKNSWQRNYTMPNAAPRSMDEGHGNGQHWRNSHNYNNQSNHHHHNNQNNHHANNSNKSRNRQSGHHHHYSNSNSSGSWRRHALLQPDVGPAINSNNNNNTIQCPNMANRGGGFHYQPCNCQPCSERNRSVFVTPDWRR
ncbi:hypothetical protein CDD82_6612 [Ophiocordyceps australis]|uniref:Uncharacterized protein n=1 Tax=Ophiocordyceps australis TaxID=1399860 RepID=A0A2C5ZVU3_9HYPO|nr:hypothetical protein CDD82_6612 [Ophiocordyceps australis]